MTRLVGTLVMSGTLVLLPALARAQEEQGGGWSDLGIGEPESAAPATPEPSGPPPAPQYDSQYQAPQAAPQYEAQPQYEAPPQDGGTQPQYGAPAPQAQAAAPSGQWIYTQQYGWIWMPYADAYTRAPSNGYGEPYAYVYAPAYSCWAWVAAPWVWGIGPWPFFGAIGPVHFGWYGHGWWRYPQRWHYAPSYRAFAGMRPAPGFRGPVHGGFRTAPAPAPAFRGGAGFRGGASGFVGGRAPAPAPAFRGGFAGRGGGAPVFTGRGGFAGRAAPPAFTGRGGFGSRGGGVASGGHGGSGRGGGHGRGRG